MEKYIVRKDISDREESRLVHLLPLTCVSRIFSYINCPYSHICILAMAKQI